MEPLCTEIRTAFLNAPRRDDGRTIVMVPSVFNCPKRRDVDRRQGGVWTNYQPTRLERSPGHRDPKDGVGR